MLSGEHLGGFNTGKSNLLLRFLVSFHSFVLPVVQVDFFFYLFPIFLQLFLTEFDLFNGVLE